MVKKTHYGEKLNKYERGFSRAKDLMSAQKFYNSQYNKRLPVENKLHKYKDGKRYYTIRETKDGRLFKQSIKPDTKVYTRDDRGVTAHRTPKTDRQIRHDARKKHN